MEKVLALVTGEVAALNEELGYDTLENPTADTAVFSGDDAIDSLSLVTLIVALERAVSEQFGQTVSLADEKAMSQKNSPYATVGSLAALIAGRLEE